MTPRHEPRTTDCSPGQARDRLRTAKAYLELAELASTEPDPSPFQRAAWTGNAVLAGIAAADAICGFALGRYSRGQDHAQAADLLGTVQLGSASLATRVSRLLALKNSSHYSAASVTAQQADQALRIARDLVAEADRTGQTR